MQPSRRRTLWRSMWYWRYLRPSRGASSHLRLLSLSRYTCTWCKCRTRPFSGRPKWQIHGTTPLHRAPRTWWNSPYDRLLCWLSRGGLRFRSRCRRHRWHRWSRRSSLGGTCRGRHLIPKVIPRYNRTWWSRQYILIIKRRLVCSRSVYPSCRMPGLHFTSGIEFFIKERLCSIEYYISTAHEAIAFHALCFSKEDHKL